MLENLRKHQSSFLIWVVFGIIIAAFILSFGPGDFGRAQFGDTDLGTVNGETIPQNRFEMLFEREYEQRRQYDKNLDDAKIAEIKSNVVKRLVDSILWLQNAEDRGLVVSDKLLAKEIMDNPAFQEDGKFDQDRYSKYVAFGFRTTIKKYEDELRREIGSGFLRDAMADSAIVTKEEAWETYRIDQAKVDLEFIQISLDKLALLGFTYTPDDAAIAAYAKANDEKLKEYFDAHKDELKTGGEATVAEVILPVAADAPADVVDKAKKQAKAFGVLLKPDTFEEQMKKLNAAEAVVMPLETVKQGSRAAAWDAVVFTDLKPGSVSEPLKLADGFHLIYLKERTDGAEAGFDDPAVKTRIAGILVKRDAEKAFATEKADSYIAQLKEGKTVNQVVPYETPEGEAIKTEGPTAVVGGSTGDFSRNSAGYIRGIGVAKDIMAKAFSLTDTDRVAGPFTLDKDMYVIRLKSRTEADKAKFEEDFDKNAYINQWPHRSASTEEYTAWMREHASVDTGY